MKKQFRHGVGTGSSAHKGGIMEPGVMTQKKNGRAVPMGSNGINFENYEGEEWMVRFQNLVERKADLLSEIEDLEPNSPDKKKFKKLLNDVERQIGVMQGHQRFGHDSRDQ